MMLDGEFKNFSWERSKKLMSNLGSFLSRLQDYDKENLSDHLVSKLEPIVNDPVMDFEVMMSGKSSAAANLAAWVVATYTYNRIYVKVKPLMEKLEEAKAAKAKAEGQAATAQRFVDDIQARLSDLRTSLLAATEEKRAVELQAEHCQSRLSLAERGLSMA